MLKPLVAQAFFQALSTMCNYISIWLYFHSFIDSTNVHCTIPAPYAEADTRVAAVN